MQSTLKKEYPFWLFILFPAITMLLGWGLRGFIGGGPFGAMIPGAMLMLSIALLLDIPFAPAAVMVVFGTAGIGMGGEMTYGQTLGFLRNPETVWWGTCGTTVKGGAWGLVGGTFIGLGLLHRSIDKKTIIVGLLIFLLAFLAGLKLINDPKVIYFSDPINKPRQESWAGLLFGAIALLSYLKVKTSAAAFRILIRFTCYGLVGGALGFGLGAFWLVLGSQVAKTSWITDWWKLMEFSFGFIMGGFFGYAAWCCRKEIGYEPGDEMFSSREVSYTQQLLIAVALGIVIYLVIPLMDPFVEARNTTDGAALIVLRTIARLFTNYTFIGSLLIVVALRWPLSALQIAITLTFSHTMIDLVEDLQTTQTLVRGCLVLLASAGVSILVSKFQRNPNVLKSMMMTLVWSTLAVAIARMLVLSQFRKGAGDSLWKFVIGDMLVFNFFVISAIIVSFLTIRRMARGFDTPQTQG